MTGSGRDEKLQSISGFGLESWFRDLYQESFYTQKLGGYDPYMDEYVLSSNDVLLPSEAPCWDCRSSRDIIVTTLTPVTFCINNLINIGTGTLDYGVLADNGTDFNISITYDGVTVSTGDVSTGGNLTYNVTNPYITEASVVITATGGSFNLSLISACPVPTLITLVQACFTTQALNGQVTTNSSNYSVGTNFSPRESETVTFLPGANPVVSQYNRVTGPQGSGAIPIDGSTVYLYNNDYMGNTFTFDHPGDNFGWLLSNTYYDPTDPADMATLLSSYTPLVTDTSNAPTQYEAQFTMPPAVGGDFLYLIYDYRRPTTINLCYDLAVDGYDVCCECTTSQGCTGYDSTRVFSGPNIPCATPRNSTYYHTGIGAEPDVGDAVFFTALCEPSDDGSSNGYLDDGWYYIGTGTSVIYVTSGIVVLKQNCV